MKFDYVIGNPPYQDETLGDNKGFAPPVYNKFLDASYEIADKVEMIHPARFLFNAGSTPKAWNEKMLSDPHLTVLHYESDSSKIFANTDIKGGVVITYRDKVKNYGAIEHFIVFDELRSIARKIGKTDYVPLSKVIYEASAQRDGLEKITFVSLKILGVIRFLSPKQTVVVLLAKLSQHR